MRDLVKVREYIDKIESYRKRMEHKFDFTYYKNRALMLERFGVPKMLFDNIIAEGVENVREVGGKQLAFMSNHVSMADYLMQGYIFWKDKLPIPRFLAGENLNRLALGRFFRRCGAIFIDRNERDRLYWKVLDGYIKEVLSDNESLLIYPEGTRKDKDFSRKLKTGAVGWVVDAVENGRDIYVVPTYACYDKRIEEAVIEKVRENKRRRDILLAKTNKLRKEGKEFRADIAELRARFRDKLYFGLDLFPYFQRPFDKQKGNAYVIFGKPFSITDFFKKNGDMESKKDKKKALAEKVGEEIERLENLYKDKKL